MCVFLLLFCVFSSLGKEQTSQKCQKRVFQGAHFFYEEEEHFFESFLEKKKRIRGIKETHRERERERERHSKEEEEEETVWNQCSGGISLVVCAVIIPTTTKKI